VKAYERTVCVSQGFDPPEDRRESAMLEDRRKITIVWRCCRDGGYPTDTVQE